MNWTSKTNKKINRTDYTEPLPLHYYKCVLCFVAGTDNGLCPGGAHSVFSLVHCEATWKERGLGLPCSLEICQTIPERNSKMPFFSAWKRGYSLQRKEYSPIDRKWSARKGKETKAENYFLLSHTSHFRPPFHSCFSTRPKPALHLGSIQNNQTVWQEGYRLLPLTWNSAALSIINAIFSDTL